MQTYIKEDNQLIAINPLRAMYLDFLNNYLTIERFAEDYMLTHTQAIHILDAGKEVQSRFEDRL